MASTWKEYWEKHGARIRERRRKRYAEDKDYREKVLKENQERQAPARKRGSGHQPREYVQPAHIKPLVVEFGGARIVLVPIGKAAAELGYHVQTLRNWIKNNVIPEPFTDQAARRWFSERYVRFLKEVVPKYRHEVGGWATSRFGPKVWTDFRRQTDIPEHKVNGG